MGRLWILYTFDMHKRSVAIFSLMLFAILFLAMLFISAYRTQRAAAPVPAMKNDVDTYEEYAQKNGTKAALALIHATIAKDPVFDGTCHDIMHHVAHVAVTEYGSFQSAYAHGTYDCGNGYFHGVVEEVLRQSGVEGFTPSAIGHFCDDVPVLASATRAFAVLNCVHGLGHALVYDHSGSLAAALPLCVEIKGDDLRSECTAGAFMENMIERLLQREQSDPGKNPSLTCASVAGDAHLCWVALAALAIAAEEHELLSAVAFCARFDSALFRAACGEGLGKAVAIARAGAVVSDSSYCERYAAPFVGECIRGASPYRGSSSPLYSPAFQLLPWPSATGSDPLLGDVEMLR